MASYSLLRANRPNHTHLSPTNPYSLTHLVRPMTPMSQKPVTGKISNTMPALPNLTWAGQVKAPTWEIQTIQFSHFLLRSMITTSTHAINLNEIALALTS